VVDAGGKGRVVFVSLGSENSGVRREWAATADGPGVYLLEDLSVRTAEAVGERMRRLRRPGDVVVASIHWGPNWGYPVSREEVRFARRLIDTGGVDVVHGHSSHHIKGIEVYQGRLILYGCGDFLNDYEGIRGHEDFRGDLGLMYLASLHSSSGRLAHLEMVPTRVRRFRVERSSADDAAWLMDVLSREGSRFGTRARPGPDGRLVLHWD
jgi:poly-gamma-glutamate synthesis protein (capsule biosynthesis protein)